MHQLLMINYHYFIVLLFNNSDTYQIKNIIFFKTHHKIEDYILLIISNIFSFFYLFH